MSPRCRSKVQVCIIRKAVAHLSSLNSVAAALHAHHESFTCLHALPASVRQLLCLMPCTEQECTQPDETSEQGGSAFIAAVNMLTASTMTPWMGE